MKSILEKWEGCFDIDGYVRKDLKDFNPNDKEEFHIKLVQREDKEDDKNRKY